MKNSMVVYCMSNRNLDIDGLIKLLDRQYHGYKIYVLMMNSETSKQFSNQIGDLTKYPFDNSSIIVCIDEMLEYGEVMIDPHKFYKE